MGHFFILYRFDHGLGIKLGMQNISRPQIHGRHEGQKGPIKDDGSGMEDNALRMNTEGRRHVTAVHGPHIVGMDDSFGQSGGAAAVNNVVWILVTDFHLWGCRL